MDTALNLIKELKWVVGIAVIIWYFRLPLTNLINALSHLAGRTTKVGPVEFHQGKPSTKELERKLQESNTNEDPTLDLYVTKVREEVKELKLTDLNEVNERLVFGLAQTYRHIDYRSIARPIFGTQIAALKEIVASVDGVPQAALEKIHEDHEIRILGTTKGDPLDFLSWIGFLRDNGLVSMNSAGRYSATDQGRTFVKFAAHDGVSESKPF